MCTTLQQMRCVLAAKLSPMPNAERVARIWDAAVAHGGTFIPAGAGGSRGSPWAELDLLGVYAQGDDEVEAVEHWRRQVARIATQATEDAA